METVDVTQTVAEDLMRVGYNVATNKRNTLGLPIFTARGVGNSKPDLFFWDPEFENEIFSDSFIPKKIDQIRDGFIELKTGNKFSEILDGIKQNTMYYTHFITNKGIFSINGQQIHSVDVFVLGTLWSRTGMIYKGDENCIPRPLPYLTERYNFLTYPFTMSVHSMHRTEQKYEKFKLRNSKISIAKNKIKVETGIMISKTPVNDNDKISYEYYAWLGNRLFPITVKDSYNQEYIKTKVKVLDISEKAFYIETLNRENEWLPKSQVLIDKKLKSIEIGEWLDVKIPLWLYKKREKSFGLT